MITWLSLSIGAIVGAALRWQLSILMPSSGGIAWGTLSANAIGAWLIGLLFVFLDQASDLSAVLRLALMTGLLGSLTTFSTFSLETVRMMQSGQWGWALVYVLLSVVGSLLLTYCGMRMAMWLTN